MKIEIIKSEIDKIDLTHLVDNITRDDHKKIIVSRAGLEHYKLLAYLSKQMNNSIIVELGTHHGTSCLCLCENESNAVITYDLTSRKFGLKKIPNNLTRYIGNIFDINPEILIKSSLIFLDTSHEGEFETKVFNYLVENDYKGILLLDDIHYNNIMINFWNSIKLPKYDITSVGHGVYIEYGYNDDTLIESDYKLTGKSGTGLVDFNNNVSKILL